MIKGQTFTPEQLESLKRTAFKMQKTLNEIYTPERALETRVTDSYPMVIPDTLRQKYDISKYGRKSISGDDIVIHACPHYHPRPLQWVSVDSNMIESALKYAQKGSATYNQDEVKEMELVNSKPGAGSYEKALFAKLKTPFVIVSPGGSTIWNAADYQHYVTADPSDYQRIESHYSMMNRPVPWLDRTDAKSLIHYYGFHGVPEGQRARIWCAFHPNPLASHLYKYLQKEESQDRIVLEYQARIRHRLELHYRPTCRRYSAKTVDMYLNLSYERYCLETNMDLGVKRDQSIYFSSLFLDGVMPLKGPDGIVQDEQYVWDVPGSGTYFSRRGRIIQEAERLRKVPVPFQPYGHYPVGMQTEELIQSPMYRTARGMTLMPIRRYDRLPPTAPTGVLITANNIDPPLMLCPGLFFRHVRFDAHLATLDTVATDPYVFCRNLTEVEVRLPLIIKFFSIDTPAVIPHSVSPAEDWRTIAVDVEKASDMGLTLGQLVKRTNMAVATYGHYFKRNPTYVLLDEKYYAHVGFVNDQEEDDRGQTPITHLRPLVDIYDLKIRRADELFDPGWYDAIVRGAGAERSAVGEFTLRATRKHYVVRDNKVYVSS